MKALAPLLLFAVGCGDLTPAPALTVHDRAGLGAFMAFSAVTAAAKPAPPAPSPDKPDDDDDDDDDDACGECGGSGKLGDGTVFVKCTACNGTGKKQDAPTPPEIKPAARPAPPAAPLLERYAVPPKDGRAYRKICNGRECWWEPVQ